MTTVLVTGAAGFIGSHMVKLLLKEGFNVIAVDNLRSGRIENLKDVLNRIHFYKIDIRNEEIGKVIREADIVIHMAAVVNIQDFYERPKEGFDINVNGTVNLLEYARKYEVELFEFASSAAVYGNPIKLPISEDHPTNPLHPYGASKLAGEKIGMTYFYTYGLKFIGFRIFNVYGPRMTGGFYAGVIAKFIESALSGKPLTIFGSGEQTRDFIYVEDITNGFLAGIKRRKAGIFNLGTGRVITINELAKIIKRLTNSDSQIIWTNPRPGDIMHSQADISKAKSELGWEPKFDILTGLKRTIDWYRCIRR